MPLDHSVVIRTRRPATVNLIELDTRLIRQGKVSRTWAFTLTPNNAAMKTRLLLIAAALVTATVIVHDASVPAGRGFAARTAIFMIDEYRSRVSPRLEGVVTCRFAPTCSAYGREAFAKYGFAPGSLKTVGRIARCGPWTRMGTVDPP